MLSVRDALPSAKVFRMKSIEYLWSVRVGANSGKNSLRTHERHLRLRSLSPSSR